MTIRHARGHDNVTIHKVQILNCDWDIRVAGCQSKGLNISISKEWATTTKTGRAGIATVKSVDVAALALGWPTRPLLPLPRKDTPPMPKAWGVNIDWKTTHLFADTASAAGSVTSFSSRQSPGKLKTCFTGLASRWTSLGLSDRPLQVGRARGLRGAVDPPGPSQSGGLQSRLSTHKSDRQQHSSHLCVWKTGIWRRVRQVWNLFEIHPTSRDVVLTLGSTVGLW